MFLVAASALLYSAWRALLPPAASLMLFKMFFFRDVPQLVGQVQERFAKFEHERTELQSEIQEEMQTREYFAGAEVELEARIREMESLVTQARDEVVPKRCKRSPGTNDGIQQKGRQVDSSISGHVAEFEGREDSHFCAEASAKTIMRAPGSATVTLNDAPNRAEQQSVAKTVACLIVGCPGSGEDSAGEGAGRLRRGFPSGCPRIAGRLAQDTLATDTDGCGTPRPESGSARTTVPQVTTSTFQAVSKVVAPRPASCSPSPATYPPSPPGLPDLGSITSTSGSLPGTSASRQEESSGLLQGNETAAEVFERAEAFCEAQQFQEAAVLFRRVLAALHGSPDHKLKAVEAEVWAHLGVAMQSLDDIEAAIESYSHAVVLDPALHVCFANLATLYMYLEDWPRAQNSITQALLLQPDNIAYLDIQSAAMHTPPRSHQMQR